jgi:hypothetical protein
MTGAGRMIDVVAEWLIRRRRARWRTAAVTGHPALEPAEATTCVGR